MTCNQVTDCFLFVQIHFPAKQSHKIDGTDNIVVLLCHLIDVPDEINFEPGKLSEALDRIILTQSYFMDAPEEMIAAPEHLIAGPEEINFKFCQMIAGLEHLIGDTEDINFKFCLKITAPEHLNGENIKEIV